MSDKKAVKPMTGRTVLYWLLGFFAVIFIANAILIRLALESFPGLVTETAYEDGLAYNDTIAAARAQAELGWKVEGTVNRGDDGAARIAVSAHDKDGAPLAGLLVTARLQRTASPEAAHIVVLQEGELGLYTADLANVETGNWLLNLSASRGEGDRQEDFRSDNRIYLR
ncbi:FixH family protein [Stappia sp.]|jgi:nitrogen fixation protein FixH|uniref:FixH family protein n=1 Tax=Stappia sp. TaxID=1870903 RepID=UPI003A993F35